MPVTVSIEGNHNYCRKNNLLQDQPYNCPTCIGVPGDTGCIECKGKGVAGYQIYPFELVMTKQDFSDFLATVELTYVAVDCRIWGQRLAGPLTELVDLIHDQGETVKDYYTGPANDYTKVCNYVLELYELCQEAIRREEMVVWQTH